MNAVLILGLVLQVAAGPPPPPPSAQAGATAIIIHGPRDAARIALTFDACRTRHPDDYDEKVIEILLREQVPATIFISGRWAEKNADTAKMLGEQPLFEIANHAFWHPHLREKDDERVLLELQHTQTVLKELTGRLPRYFRAPYGEVDARIARLADQSGLVTVQYDIPSGDPDPNLPAGRIVQRIVRDARGGSIIVFHVNRNGVHTAEMLPDIISGLRQKGFELVTVGDLLKKEEPALPPARSDEHDRSACP